MDQIERVVDMMGVKMRHSVGSDQSNEDRGEPCLSDDGLHCVQGDHAPSQCSEDIDRFNHTLSLHRQLHGPIVLQSHSPSSAFHLRYVDGDDGLIPSVTDEDSLVQELEEETCLDRRDQLIALSYETGLMNRVQHVV